MDYNSTMYVTDTASAGFVIGWMLAILAMAVLMIVAMWRIFAKAGEAGWKAVIPFYNTYILYKITWGNGLYFLLLLIPCANFVIQIITSVKLAKVFGKEIGFTLGLIFLGPIFQLILAFDSSEYQGV